MTPLERRVNMAAVFLPFAVTIAVSVAISGLVALTLSPALCRLLLKPGHGKKMFLFRWFDRAFGGITSAYTGGVRLFLHNALTAMVVHLNFREA